ncbi:MAG: hypothetical protein J0M24_21125 [Verrucomicrobia bacterium]|nr:hypothetical protein [Verrucomicrobiota bacterium]
MARHFIHGGLATRGILTGCCLWFWAMWGCGFLAAAFEFKDGAFQVYPGDHLQDVINRAARNPKFKTVRIHPGVYRPRAAGQALIYLNRTHDGVRIMGVGRPTLTAANEEIADRTAASFPAVVNHVIYLGDGLGTNTLVENLRLTGANHFVTNSLQDLMEPDRTIPKGRFYFGDGGAIKVYRRSAPVLRDLEIVDNYASPCAGGISIQQEGATNEAVLVENCVFRNNRAEVTGAALDLLWGSRARVVNCFFVGNISNTGPGEGENPFNNNGAITVFPRSRLEMERCTLVGNRNGVDDQSGQGSYFGTIFAANTRDGGEPGLPRFELDLPLGGVVRECVISGGSRDPHHALTKGTNVLNPEGLRFTADFVPEGNQFQRHGYRPGVPTAAP